VSRDSGICLSSIFKIPGVSHLHIASAVKIPGKQPKRMKKHFLTILFVSIYCVASSQLPRYYCVPEIKAYFTYYKNNTINFVFNDTLNTAFNKYNDSLYQIVFYSRKKVLAKCICIYKGVERKEYIWIKRSDGKMVLEKYFVRELMLKDTACLKLLPAEIINQTRDLKY
jgi:hypothetical protein